MSEHEARGLEFFDKIRADLAAEGVVVRASDWLLEADEPPEVCPPQPLTRALRAERLWHWHRRDVCRGGTAGSTCPALDHYRHLPVQCEVGNDG